METGSKIFLDIPPFTLLFLLLSFPPSHPPHPWGWRRHVEKHPLIKYLALFLEASVSYLFMQRNWLSDARAKLCWGNKEWTWGEMEEICLVLNSWVTQDSFDFVWGWGFAVPCLTGSKNDWLLLRFPQSSFWNLAGSLISQGQRTHQLLSIFCLLLLGEGWCTRARHPGSRRRHFPHTLNFSSGVESNVELTGWILG